MISNEIDEKKTKYFVIAIILLILLSVILVIHFNNKSLVSGEEEYKTTTTSTTTTAEIIKITTTKKKETKKNNSEVEKEEVVVETLEQEKTIYKSTIDEVNKLIYNYKLTEEISESDKIISTVLTVDEKLKSNNIIGLYDISLYDLNMVKKNVSNSLIDISIPLTNDLIGYDEYKIVYIDEKNKITAEEFKFVIDNGYIKFSTTHLSKFGIIGIKKEVVEEPKEEIEVIDLTNVTIDVKINDSLIADKNIYVSTTDKIDVIVNGLDKEYKLYYLLLDENGTNTYQEFKTNIFDSIDTPSKYTLFIKIEAENMSKVFEIGTVNIYDIIFVYDKEEDLEQSVTIGEIKDDEGNESEYIKPELNKDIVINVVEEETDIIESTKVPSKDNIEITEEQKNEISVDNLKQESTTVSSEETLDEKTGEDETNEKQDDSQEESKSEENVAKIILKGNIYLVEETDISALEIIGHLIIDTKENITFVKNDTNVLLSSNIYTITIKSKEFSLNGVMYTYEYIGPNLVIKKLEDNTEVSDVENIFNGYQIDETKEELVLNKVFKEETDNNTNIENNTITITE